MRPKPLPKDELDAALAGLPGWRFDAERNGIRREYVFKDFSAAFACMTRIALKAEQMDHHPDWRNVYNRLELTLSTHDAGGVTELDVALARFCERLASSSN